jgi:penicillin-binding protein 1A
MERARARRFNVDQMALAAVDIQTGAIKAMVGGMDYSQSQYNRAVQGGRQAGSAFKPFVYTAAMEQGYTPDSIVYDEAVTYPGAMGRPWTPRNYDGEYHGPVTFREALAHSYNVAAVRVADAVGVGAVIAAAERMGIYHEMEDYLPLAIGYCDVSPLEMASSYAVFATGGMRTEPFAIRRIEDAQGRTIEEHTVRTWRVLHEQVAAQMVDMLSEVVRSGTGSVTRYWYKGPAVGKTGTSNDFKDSWFIGFSGDLCAATWMGNDQFQPTGPRGRGKGVSGATIPAPVWARFMAKAVPAMAAEEAERPRVVEIRPSDMSVPEAPEPPEEPPDGGGWEMIEGEVEGGARTATKRICPSSGLLAGPYCPRAVQVTYDLEAGGRPPDRQCDEHTSPPEGAGVEPEAADLEGLEERPQREEKVRLPICAITEQIATPRCPVVVIRQFEAGEAPTESCTRHRR